MLGLRWLPLACLALVPLACSGTTTNEHGADVGGSGAGDRSLAGAGGASTPGATGGTSDAGTTNPAGAGGAGSRHGLALCEAPMADAPAQLVACANGMEHRAVPSVCGNDAGGAAGAGAEPTSGGADAGGGEPEPAIYSPCRQDRDCSAGFACLCADGVYAGKFYNDPRRTTACLSAKCRTDADCGVGSFCTLTELDYFGEAVIGFGCTNAADECLTDADCASLDTSSGGLHLCVQNDDHRRCSFAPI